MATNWTKAVSEEDFNELNAKVGSSTDDETKATLFGKIAKVFQAVSNGKSKIATAITGKGIVTLGSDTFTKMAGNIDLIKMVTGTDAGKILAGQSINGISGTATNDANAVAGDMLSGKTGYAKGLKVSGTMANNGAVGTAIANGALKQGYTIGGAIANLVAGNVKRGVNIGGVVGNIKAFGEPLSLSEYSTTAFSYTAPDDIGAVFVINNYNSKYFYVFVPFICVFYSTSTDGYNFTNVFGLCGSNEITIKEVRIVVNGNSVSVSGLGNYAPTLRIIGVK